MRVVNFNLVKKHKRYGCCACEHNPMGVCELCGREVPIGKVLGNGRASWCPMGKEKK